MMDPDACLKELLKMAGEFQQAMDACPEDEEPSIDAVDVARMAELVQSLDHWIKGGGFLPKRWYVSRPVRVDE